MSLLIGFAIVGKNNEPLYLCDCDSISNSIEKDNNDAPLVDGDVNGLAAKGGQSTEQRHSLPVHRQIIIHAALDCLSEKIQTNSTGQMPVIKNATRQVPHWVGLILQDSFRGGWLDSSERVQSPEEEDGASSTGCCVYAYITATNIKFMALTSHPVSGPNDLQSLQRFLRELHEHYSTYVSNPFCNTRGPIVSPQFDARVNRSIEKMKQPVVYVD